MFLFYETELAVQIVADLSESAKSPGQRTNAIDRELKNLAAKIKACPNWRQVSAMSSQKFQPQQQSAINSYGRGAQSHLLKDFSGVVGAAGLDSDNFLDLSGVRLAAGQKSAKNTEKDFSAMH